MAFHIKVPDIMPVLSHGSHHHPAEGACFMEYTALLAGEPFSDRPRCVDDEIASVMMWINDSLPDADRHLLVPMLGRGIGLTVPRRPRQLTKAKAAKMTPEEILKYQERAGKRAERWEDTANEVRREVQRRLAKQYPGLRMDIPLSGAITGYFDRWQHDTRNRLIEVVDGRHDANGHCKAPCKHHLKPAHRNAAAKLLEIADTLHNTYEGAMEARGWAVKRELACELPAVMEKIGK